ncbi:MAG: sigma-70 family RNA polymerase sigma factor [Acholeplasmatales bacterium]|nr:sigma-70 family RNA polymerase sigma factor [Acholeplasmatales bacterium]
MKDREYIRIYDDIYRKFAEQMKDYDENDNHIAVVAVVVDNLPPHEQIAIRSFYRYGDYHKAAKMTNVDQKTFSKSVSSARRHLESPNNIALVVPDYYKIDYDNSKALTKEDFGNKQYVITQLHRSGIYYKEQLIKHLSNGWNYLWTIPGCGEGARKLILLALDNWDIRIGRLM